MRRAAALGVLVVASVACAQEVGGIEAIRQAYRAQPTADRLTIDVPRGAAPAARSELVVAIRTGADPAVSLALGRDDPLRVLAEPGRLLAWRESDRDRVFAAVLGEPFGRAAIEAVLPPLLAPQIDLAFDPEPGAGPDGLLAVMPDLSWSLVASGEVDRYAGVAAGAALELEARADGRLASMEAQREGVVLARASIEAIDVDAAWFQPPSLDGTLVGSLADLGRTPGPVRVGELFGHAIGVDARGRATTLRAVAGDGERVVVLMVDARMPEDRTRLAGALAEAELADLASKLGVTVVVLAVGEDDAAALFGRVTRASRASNRPVRTLAVDAMPAWAPAIGEGVAFAVRGRSWVFVGAHAVAAAEAQHDAAGPQEASVAPRSLSERLVEVVSAAGRE